ncbi:MAG: DUF1653 domain-containing protein [Curvibacter lanceolatus]|jgi:hypothetical protein|uniref:DUF1653 domain-containing protein n=1 Tax=Curvibacter lanceolatus TaxID=86182 RepID=UPI0003A31BF8|nr:DUF1653 domain-containing protein [Curvibacter lanceolatus]MBV5292117.1 DUF1653 domain-containing protein [Curvibacter lanceolatus]
MPDDSDLPELSPRVPPGLYRHYRGGLYRVIDTVRHSETLEPLTLYQALYGQQGLWVRPAAMFLENVEVEGRRVQRFTAVHEPDLPGA